MVIPVLGMDPSLRNWGLAAAMLDLDTGVLSNPVVDVIITGDEPKSKQVRMNSFDIEAAHYLSDNVFEACSKAKVVFVEVPHGSQSASGMKGYGVCIGILGALRSKGVSIIEVSESESKKTFTGKRTAAKEQMIQTAVECYPDSNWPIRGGKIVAGKAEHMADAIAAIHAGVLTPEFQSLMRLFSKV